MATFSRIQTGTTTLSGTSATATISTVTLANSYLVFTARLDSSNIGEGNVRGRITSTTQLTFDRASNGATVTIEWQVIEWSSGVTVQRGTQAMDPATANVTITAVSDLNKAWCDSYPYRIGSSMSQDDLGRHILTSTTNLRLVIIQTMISHVKSWQVIEHDEATVQRDSAKAITASTDSTTISTVDLTKAFTVGGVSLNGGYGVDGLPTHRLSDSTTISYERYIGDSVDVDTQVVELSGVSVQRSYETVPSASGSYTSTFSEVSASGTAIFLGGMSYYANTANTTDDDMGRAWFTGDLTDTTTVTLQRNNTGSEAKVPVQVVDFQAVTGVDFTTTHSTIELVPLSHSVSTLPLQEGVYAKLFAHEAATSFDCNVTSWTAVPYDVTDIETDASVIEQTSNTDFHLKQTGLYLVDYGVASRNDTYDNRIQWETRLTLDSTDLIYGHGEGYRRDANNDRFLAKGHAIIDVTATGLLNVEIQRIGDYSSTHLLEAGRSWITIIKLHDKEKYFRAKSHDTSDAISTDWKKITWDEEDRKDTGFTHAANGSGIILDESGLYYVSYQVTANNDSTQRNTLSTSIEIDNSSIPYGRAYSYSRYVDGTDLLICTAATLIQTSGNNQELTLDYRRFNTISPGDYPLVSGESTISIWKMPLETNAVLAYANANKAIDGGSDNTDLVYNVVDREDPPFSVVTASGHIYLSNTSGYLLMQQGGRANRTGGTASDRLTNSLQWFKSGSEYSYGRSTMYIRGNEGSTDCFDGGHSSERLFWDVQSGQYLHIRTRDDGDNGDSTDAMIANQYAVTGFDLDSLPSGEAPSAQGVDFSTTAGTLEFAPLYHGASIRDCVNLLNPWTNDISGIYPNAGSNRVIVVTFSTEAPTEPTRPTVSVTYGGVPLTSGIESFYSDGDDNWSLCGIYYGLESVVASGLGGDVSVTYGGISSNVNDDVHVAIYQNVDQAAPIVDVQENSSGTGTSISTSALTTGSGAMAIMTASSRDAADTTSVGTFANQYETDVGTKTQVTADKFSTAATESPTVTWNASQDRLVIASLALKCSKGAEFNHTVGTLELQSLTHAAAGGGGYSHTSSVLEFLALNHTAAGGGGYSHTSSVLEFLALNHAVTVNLGDGIFPGDWNRRCPLTISGAYIFCDLTDFNVAITASGLPAEIFNTIANSGAMTNGDDVRFTSDIAGTQLLNFEKVNFDKSTINNTEFHVQVPTLTSGTSETIYVWYNRDNTNPYSGVASEIWSDYAAVYHLQYPAASGLPDSSPSGFDLPYNQGSGPTISGSTDEYLGHNLTWTATADEYFGTTSYGVPGLGLSGYLLEAVVYSTDSAVADRGIVSTQDIADAPGDAGLLGLRFDSAGFLGPANDCLKCGIQTTLGPSGHSIETVPDNVVSVNTWLYLGNKWLSGSNWEQFVNETVYGGSGLVVIGDNDNNVVDYIPSGVTASFFTVSGIFVGRGPKNEWEGKIAEVRLRKSYVPDCYTKTNYHNLLDHNFVTAGTPTAAAQGVDFTHEKSILEFQALSHVVGFSAAVTQSASTILLEALDHQASGGASHTHTAQILEFVANTHSGAGGASVQHTIQHIDLVTGVHSPSTGASYASFIGIVEFVARSHTAATGASYAHDSSILEFVPGSHTASTGAIHEHTISTLELVSLTHTAQTGASHAHTVGILEFVPLSHTVQTGASYAHSANILEFVTLTHLADVVEFSHTASILEFVTGTHQTATGTSFAHTISALELVGGGHTGAGGGGYTPDAGVIELVALTHTVSTGASFAHTIEELIFVPGSHTGSGGASYAHSISVLELVSGTHQGSGGGSYSQDVAILELVALTHQGSGGASYTHSIGTLELVALDHKADTVEFVTTISVLEFVAGTHTVQTGASYAHSVGTLELVAGTHTGSGGASVSHSANTIEFVPLTHVVFIGINISAGLGILEFEALTHTTAAGGGYAPTVGVLEFVALDNQGGGGASYQHSAETILFEAGGHTASTGAAYTHSISVLEFLGGSHTGAGGVSYQTDNGVLELVSLEHTVQTGASYQTTIGHLVFETLSQTGGGGASFAHSIQTIEFEAGTHVTTGGTGLVTTIGVIELVPGSHTIAAGGGYATTIGVIELVPGNNQAAVAIIAEHSASTLVFVTRTHIVTLIPPEVPRYIAPDRPDGSYVAPTRICHRITECVVLPPRPDGEYVAPDRVSARYVAPPRVGVSYN